MRGMLNDLLRCSNLKRLYQTFYPKRSFFLIYISRQAAVASSTVTVSGWQSRQEFISWTPLISFSYLYADLLRLNSSWSCTRRDWKSPWILKSILKTSLVSFYSPGRKTSCGRLLSWTDLSSQQHFLYQGEQHWAVAEDACRVTETIVSQTIISILTVVVSAPHYAVPAGHYSPGTAWKQILLLMK